MSLYTEAIQKLYVAYFSRPADPAGLAYWEGVVGAAAGNTSAVSAAFAASAEYKAAYAGKSASLTVDTVYMNLFGRHAESAGLAYWGPLVDSGTLTIDVVVTAVAGGAQGADLTAYNSKVAAATAFTNALDTAVEKLSYVGGVAIGRAISFLAGVTDAGSLATATQSANLDAAVLSLSAPVAPPVSLTGAADNLTGTAGDDRFVATLATLNTGDRISAGAGTDTLALSDATVPAASQLVVPGASISLASVEAVSIASSGGVDLQGASWAGVKTIKIAAGGSAGVAVIAPAGTDIDVAGAAMSKVRIEGAANVGIDNTGTAGASGQGTSLTTVLLDGVHGSGITIKGAGVRTLDLAGITQGSIISVENQTVGHALAVMLDDVGYDAQGESVGVELVDAYAASISIESTAGYNRLALSAANAQTLTLGGPAWLAVDMNAGLTSRLATVDASAMTGELYLIGLGPNTHTIVTGAGSDTLGLTTATAKDNPATAFNETISASVSTGAGDDRILLWTSGDGKVMVNAGEGDDDVYLLGRSGNEQLSIALGGGADRFDQDGAAIKASDSVQGGAGSDMLGIAGITAASGGAFSGFEWLDASGLKALLDVGVLTSKNVIEGIVVEGNVAGGHLTNMPAGADLFATGDMEGSTLRLSMAAANELILRADFDEYGEPDLAADGGTGSFNVYNASAVHMVFQSTFLPRIPGESTTGDNLAALNVSSVAAVGATINSLGQFADNALVYTDLSSTLGTMLVAGTQRLSLTVNSTRLESIDASALTGSLLVSTASLGNGGTIRLGSGVDVVTVAASSTMSAFETVAGIEKASPAAIGSVPSDAFLAIADADTLLIAGGVVANATTVAGGSVNARGVLSFSSAPLNLEAAFAIANLAANSQGEIVVFGFLNDSFVFMQGSVDTAVKLQGVVGIVGIAETGTDAFYVV